jgi:hypothetical protein
MCQECCSRRWISVHHVKDMDKLHELVMLGKEANGKLPSEM